MAPSIFEFIQNDSCKMQGTNAKQFATHTNFPAISTSTKTGTYLIDLYHKHTSFNNQCLIT